MVRETLLESPFVGDIQPQGRDRNVLMLEGPSVAVLLGLFDGTNSEPEELPSHGVFVPDHMAVVLLNRLATPPDAAGFRWEIHIHEQDVGKGEELIHDLLDPGCKTLEVRNSVLRREGAEGNASNAQEGSLLRGGERSRVPAGIPEIGTEVDPREDGIDVLPVVGAKGHAIGGSSVDPPGFEGRNLRAAVAKGTGGGDGVTHRGLFDVRSDNANLAEFLGAPGEGRKSGAVNPIVVRNQKTHGNGRSRAAATSDRETSIDTRADRGRERSHAMRIALVYNPTAGEDDHTAEDLIRRLEMDGHEVRCETSKSEDGCEALLEEPVDVVIAAGGDGTVRRVALSCAGKGIPLSILALGTANNVAQSLGLRRPEEEIVRGLLNPVNRPLDLGVVDGPWGPDRFIEGFGAGLLGEFLTRIKVAGTGDKPKKTRAELGRLLAESRSMPMRLWVDGEDCSGDYFLFEAMNVRSIGPFAGLAPEADPGDGLLDVVLLGEGERGEFVRYTNALLEDRPALHPFAVRRCRKIRFEWTGQLLHLDDTPLPTDDSLIREGGVEISVEPTAFEVLCPSV